MRTINKIIGFLLILVACTISNAAFSQLKGKVRKGFYTSPEKDFQIKIPPLLGAKYADYKNDNGHRFAIFTDDACQLYQIWDYGPSLLTAEDLIEYDTLIDFLNIQGEITKTKLESVHGTVCILLFKKVNGSICRVLTFSKDGERSIIVPDARVGYGFINIMGRMYQFVYQIDFEYIMFFDSSDEETQKRLLAFINGFLLIQNL